MINGEDGTSLPILAHSIFCFFLPTTPYFSHFIPQFPHPSATYSCGSSCSIPQPDKLSWAWRLEDTVVSGKKCQKTGIRFFSTLFPFLIFDYPNYTFPTLVAYSHPRPLKCGSFCMTLLTFSITSCLGQVHKFQLNHQEANKLRSSNGNRTEEKSHCKSSIKLIDFFVLLATSNK